MIANHKRIRRSSKGLMVHRYWWGLGDYVILIVVVMGKRGRRRRLHRWNWQVLECDQAFLLLDELFELGFEIFILLYLLSLPLVQHFRLLSI